MITPQPQIQRLSKYAEGGVRELLYIALPLMLVTFSSQFMLFCDRLILANYSTFAMSGASSAGSAFAVFQFSILSVAIIAEVFVGQYNGSKQYHKIGSPVWQMIWLSLMTTVIFVPLAFTIDGWVVPDAFQYEGAPYFKHLMYCCPVYGVIAALSAFYIGRGHVKLVACVVILGDLLNILLDFLLIFGVEGWVPSLGTTGSAIATNIAQVTIAVALFVCFLSRKNRACYKTNEYKLNMPLLIKEVKIGGPNAFAHVGEIAAWAFLFHVVSWESHDHVIILAVAQNIFLMFQFMSEGLTKGVTAIASNYIGGGKIDRVRKCLKSAFVVHLAILALIAIPVFLFPDMIAKAYLHDITSQNYFTFREVIQENMEWIWLYLLLDGFVWVIAGVLTAGGDTKFIMVASVLTVWIAAILPIYLIMKYIDASLSLTWKITAFYGAINVLIFAWRYMGGHWQKLDLGRG